MRIYGWLHNGRFVVMAALAGCLGLLLAVASRAEVRPAGEPAPAPPQRTPIEQTINVLDCRGEIHSLTPTAAQAARVYVFLTGECPISKSFIPLLNRLHAEWSSSGDSTLTAVWADPTTNPQEMRKFVDEYGIEFPVLIDRLGELGALFQPSHVPQAFVLDRHGRLAYSGRIDDTYPAVGKRRLAATQHDLVDAVTDLREGRAVKKPQTDCVGCFYEAQTALPSRGGQLTYARDIAPIVFANCSSCHRDGEVGPFPLVQFEDVAKRSRQIAAIVESGAMPPWMPSQRHGEFIGQRTLTAGQISAFRQWNDAGAPEGDPQDLPPRPDFSAGWRLGTPDLILSMSEDFELAAEGPDLFQNFVIPIDIPEDKLVAAVDFVPGNAKIVHHSLLFLDSTGAARRLDARTPEPGYSSFGGPGFMPTGSIGGWSPGKTPMRLSGGLGRYLKQGSDLVMQIHYHRSGKPEVDRSKVAVYFADKHSNVAADVWAATHVHDIPPGATDYKLSAVYVAPQDLQLLGVVPHMHLIGRSVKATAVLPDGSRRPIVEIPQWNFNWQDDYRFAEPLRLPKGTRLEVEAVYDNSENNPANPSSPPVRVTWGEETTHEMLYCFFLISVDDPRDLRWIMKDMIRDEVVGSAAARAKFLLNGHK